MNEAAKRKINELLIRATGHHLTKGVPGAAVEREQKLRRRLKRTRAELAQARKQSKTATGQLQKARAEVKKNGQRAAQAERRSRRAESSVNAMERRLLRNERLLRESRARLVKLGQSTQVRRKPLARLSKPDSAASSVGSGADDI